MLDSVPELCSDGIGRVGSGASLSLVEAGGAITVVSAGTVKSAGESTGVGAGSGAAAVVSDSVVDVTGAEVSVEVVGVVEEVSDGGVAAVVAVSVVPPGAEAVFALSKSFCSSSFVIQTSSRQSFLA